METLRCKATQFLKKIKSFNSQRPLLQVQVERSDWTSHKVSTVAELPCTPANLSDGLWEKKLPDEILLKIFEYCKNAEGFAFLGSALSVCESWRRVAETRCFWTEIELPQMNKQDLIKICPLLCHTKNLKLNSWKDLTTEHFQELAKHCSSSLSSLSLKGCRLNDKCLEILADSFHSLSEIDLQGVFEQESYPPILGFYYLLSTIGNRITHLTLCYNALIDVLVNNIAAYCPNLEFLDLRCGTVVDESLTVYLDISLHSLQEGCPNLRVLQLGYKSLLTNIACSSEDGFPKLEKLYIYDEVLSACELYRICKTSMQLKELEIHNNKDMLIIDGILDLPATSLERLSITRCSATEVFEFSQVIKKWRNTLTYLDLTGCKHINQALQPLCELDYEPPLRFLCAKDSDISNETINELRSRCPFLKNIIT